MGSSGWPWLAGIGQALPTPGRGPWRRRGPLAILSNPLFRFLKRGVPGAQPNDETRTALLRILELNKEMARAPRPEALPDRILDAAIELAGAERGFLIQRPGEHDGEPQAEEGNGPPWEVVAARSLDRENVRKGLHKVSHSITAHDVVIHGDCARCVKV